MNLNAHVCYLGKLLAACFVLCLNGLFVFICLDIPRVSLSLGFRFSVQSNCELDSWVGFDLEELQVLPDYINLLVVLIIKCSVLKLVQLTEI